MRKYTQARNRSIVFAVAAAALFCLTAMNGMLVLPGTYCLLVSFLWLKRARRARRITPAVKTLKGLRSIEPIRDTKVIEVTLDDILPPLKTR